MSSWSLEPLEDIKASLQVNELFDRNDNRAVCTSTLQEA